MKLGIYYYLFQNFGKLLFCDQYGEENTFLSQDDAVHKNQKVDLCVIHRMRKTQCVIGGENMRSLTFLE